MVTCIRELDPDFAQKMKQRGEDGEMELAKRLRGKLHFESDGIVVVQEFRDFCCSLVQEGKEKGVGEGLPFAKLLYHVLSETSPPAALEVVEERLGQFELLQNADVLRHLSFHTEGTREWVLEEFSALATESGEGKRVLALLGNAGTGKSVASALLCLRLSGIHAVRDRGASRVEVPKKQLEVLVEGDVDERLCKRPTVVGYAFARHNVEGRNKVLKLFATLALQIARRIPLVAENLAKEMMRDDSKVLKALESVKAGTVKGISGERGKTTADLVFEALLLGPLRAAANSGGLEGRIFVVVLDALDEIAEGEDRESILKIIKERVRELPGEIRFFLTGRPHAEIEETLKGIPTLCIEKLTERNEADMIVIARSIAEEFVQNSEDRARASELILAKAEGNFLWFRVGARDRLASVHEKGDAVTLGVVEQLAAGLEGAFEEAFVRLGHRRYACEGGDEDGNVQVEKGFSDRDRGDLWLLASMREALEREKFQQEEDLGKGNNPGPQEIHDPLLVHTFKHARRHLERLSDRVGWRHLVVEKQKQGLFPLRKRTVHFFYKEMKKWQQLVLWPPSFGLKKNDKPASTELLSLAICMGSIPAVEVLLEGNADVNALFLENRTMPLHKASTLGHTHLVAFLLKRGADANAKSRYDITPLYDAAANGHSDVASLLLDHGADVNAQTFNGNTPLHNATAFGHRDLVPLLLDRGADVNAKSRSENTPLHNAASNGLLEIATLLLKDGAHVNAKTSFSHTPLHLAVATNQKGLVDLLLGAGAAVNAENADGDTPMHEAATHGHTELAATFLEKGGDVDARNNKGSTPLQFASSKGHTTLALFLLENGAQVNSQDEVGEAPLHKAAFHGQTEVAALLLQKGASVEAKNLDGNAPLRHAAVKGNLEMAEVLIKKGANVNNRNKNGNTPLSQASIMGHTQIARLLIENGAEVNAINKDGSGPLHCTSVKGHTELATLLLEKGADVEAKDADGKTPLNTATACGHRQLAALLLEKGADANTKDKNGNTPLYNATAFGHTNLVPLLLERGADANSTSRNGNTPLHNATAFGNAGMVSSLLQAGADVNARGRNGNTSLHNAAAYGHRMIVSLLLKNGADVNAKDASGNEPIHDASSQGHREVAALLLDNGADPNAENANGDTPLEIATKKDHIELRVLLLDKAAKGSSSAF
uniref:Nephrocystin 3-like N-terminal domain-containing protein n=1 Tax=Chromera velia CCMP2878 TaxID=1169474 RepID=A0A0G4FVZ2_9ALVE|eukprot:Cvel_19049.t1-p1 / transcript=Cvel_19049.t1 / gene=Cvel_19049 / organism=Chromera_velia_CCMP2878 / gene_product=Ankyrin-1, putative / transcript_product=Ankyrin-1, putative / location=Cvel_scaffold1615:15364-26199(-) / protein_length=1173 / sequence_SO=supercontig / SO=protein_coding / is_pseudo=false